MWDTEKTIEDLVYERKKKDEISYWLFWIRSYNKLEDEQKKSVEEIYTIWKSEKDSVEFKDWIDDTIEDVLNMAKLQKENGWLLWMKTKLWFEYNWYTLDETISWYIKWKVYTVAWYSNVGKSNLTYYMLSKLIEWNNILFFSTEVNKWMVLQNMVKSKYKVSFYEALSYIENNKEQIKKDFENFTIYDNIVEFDEIQKVVEHQKPDIIVLDFVQWLIAWNKEGYEKNSYLARAIQRLAIDNNAVVFSVAQITAGATREAKSNWVFTVKWAWEYFESSDVIFHIFRPVKDEPQDLILRIEKNKFWPLREFEIEADFKNWQFK